MPPDIVPAHDACPKLTVFGELRGSNEPKRQRGQLVIEPEVTLLRWQRSAGLEPWRQIGPRKPALMLTEHVSGDRVLIE